jgi:nucleotidyltransferase/DNA polymerase involved in DNA repair
MGGGGMIAELIGVPRPMLQTVFGRELGRRIWQQSRGCDTKPEREASIVTAASRRTPKSMGIRLRRCLDWLMRSGATVTTGPVADADIVAGMIEYLGSQAGETLGQRGWQAKAIGLRMVYADGVSRIERMRLARPTNDGQELAAAAMSLFGRSEERGVAVERVDLTLTSVQTEYVTQRTDGLQHAMASAAAARA